jgi:hypothetical protein
MTIDLAVIAQGVTILLVVWVIKGVHAINGSIRSLSQWKDDHNKQDDDRHSSVIEWLKQLDRRQP